MVLEIGALLRPQGVELNVGLGGNLPDHGIQILGTRCLRVVDASVFPRIPGFFIASAIYMIGEKAAETILADSRS